jgi:hypothetical protein
MIETPTASGAQPRLWLRRLTRDRLRAPLVAVLFVVMLAAAAWFAAPKPGDGLPLSPDSSAADGTMALTDILEELGAEVVVGSEPPEDATAGVLLVDNVPDAVRASWRDLARRGGTLLVVDPNSELAPEVVGATAFGFLDPPVGRACDIDALDGAGRVQTGGGVTFAVPDGGIGCFPRGEGYWLVAQPEGDGVVVATGGPRFLVNDAIGEADNAVLAAALLAPRSGAVVAIAPPEFAAADGRTGLTDLIPDAAWLLMAQLLVAFVVVLLWRSRRLGAPVTETAHVALPGSELTMGVGALYEQTAARAHAAGLLREEARRTLASRLRLNPRMSAEEVAEAARAAGLEGSLVGAALTDPVAEDDRALVALAGTIERLRAALDRTDDFENEGATRV